MPVRSPTSRSNGSVRLPSRSRCAPRRARFSNTKSRRHKSITGSNTDNWALHMRGRSSRGGSSRAASAACNIPLPEAVPYSQPTAVSRVHSRSAATERSMEPGSSITSSDSSSSRSATSGSHEATRATVVASSDRSAVPTLRPQKCSCARRSRSISSTTPHQSHLVSVTSSSGGSAGGAPSSTATNNVRSNSRTPRLAWA